METNVIRLDKRNVEDIYYLTSMQQGMLYHYLIRPNSDLYLEQLLLEISGDVDAELLERSWNTVTQWNEMLRTVFRWKTLNHAIQVVLKEHSVCFRHFDLSEKAEGEKEKLLEQLKYNDREQRFDLHEVPFRVTLFTMEPDRHQMMVSRHHILYDGWSTGILLKELLSVYHDLRRGETPQPPKKNRFKNYVTWLSDRQDDHETYWREYLHDFCGNEELPVKRKHNRNTIPQGDPYSFDLDIETGGRIEMFEMFVKKRGLTSAPLFFTAWGLLLQCYTRSWDVLFGAVSSGRNAAVPGGIRACPLFFLQWLMTIDQ